MSVATEIQRLNTAKADIKAAIEAKGVTVPSSATIDTYDDYVSQISGGGGGGSSADTEALKGMIDRSIKSIEIPSGTTSIGKYAFSYCPLSSITIPDSVTSIDEYSFYYSYLKNLNISSGVTSIGARAFSGCYYLRNVNVPSGVTSIGEYAFSYIGSINISNPYYGALDVSNFNFDGIVASSNFKYIFSNTNLQGSITIPSNCLSGSNSGTSSTCYSLFDSASAAGVDYLTIDVYANNLIIARQMFNFNHSSNSSNMLNLKIHGSPTFLCRDSISCTVSASVTFLDCTTPPNAENYGTTLGSPFRYFYGTLYVPSAGLDAWKTKYTGIADKIQAIPT